MCNLYNITTSQEAMRQLFPDRSWIDRAGNVEPGDVHPDRLAPILCREGDDLVLRKARWGLPSPQKFHSKSGIDRGVTNVRNAGSPHWRRWLSPPNRCLVPFNRFAEPLGKGQGNAWFEPSRPAFFAGIQVEGWTSIRKLKDGETRDDLFAFLTTEPNGVVAPIHPEGDARDPDGACRVGYLAHGRLERGEDATETAFRDSVEPDRLRPARSARSD
jgi:putative SOS response-associated peptidase YedK